MGVRKLRMKQTSRIISTYASDVSGVCSALFEYGGMTIMHDASGCNSTYNTHDEPRWYDMDSMVFVSALTETDAILGDDEKLLSDIEDAARELHPAFIAIAGSPIPMLIGCDLEAVARLAQARTGIPAMGFPTNGMHSYLSGAGMAFAALAQRFADKSVRRTQVPSVNILGATPLDFSANGSIDDLRAWLEQNGFAVVGRWGMGGTLEDVRRAGAAHVNLVVSAAGLRVAQFLQVQFGTPYVLGAPTGGPAGDAVLRALHGAPAQEVAADAHAPIAVIAEAVRARAILTDLGKPARVFCPPDTPEEALPKGAQLLTDEASLIAALKGVEVLAADPLYEPIAPAGARFVRMPHEAFSGRIYRNEIMNPLKIDIKTEAFA